VDVACEEVEATALKARHERFEWANDVVDVTDAGVTESGHDHIGVPTRPLTVGVGEVDGVLFDETELDSIFAVLRVGPVAARVGRGIDAVGERSARG
jgi:hypothetical protein